MARHGDGGRKEGVACDLSPSVTSVVAGEALVVLTVVTRRPSAITVRKLKK